MRFSSFVLLLLVTHLSSLIFKFCESVPEEEVAALRAFKQAVSEDPLRMLFDWSSNGDPCIWSGIKCSDFQNHVISINFSNCSLKGFLTAEFGSLGSLQELILDNNQLYGTIPHQIGLLKSLKVLDLSVNNLFGSIPSEIGGMSSITKINLHFNGLTGAIPPELGNLVNLDELRLDRNKLHGPIPGSRRSNASTARGMSISDSNSTAGLCQLRSLKVADFSYNFLLGKIPPCLKYLPRSSFQGNCFHDKDFILQCSAQQCVSVKGQEITQGAYRQSGGGNNHQKLKQPLWLLIIEIVTGAAFVVFLVTCIAHTAKRCKSNSNAIIHQNQPSAVNDQRAASIDSGLLNNALRFSRQELEVACEDFSNIVGSSPKSIVYKGILKNGPEIAVISLSVWVSHWSSCLDVYFQEEGANMARLDHENISKLLGYCKENEPFSRMFVFEYASNGTLYEHLHYGDAEQLSWPRRIKIAIGVARGLRYLHTELRPPFIISELNSNRVYLTEDFSTKLVDFKRWNAIVSRSCSSLGSLTNGRLCNGLLETSVETSMDMQDNTYAFGMLLLELISGRPLQCKDRGSIVNWAVEYLQHPDKERVLLDPEMKNVKSEDLSVLCGVISLSIDPDPSKRPSMEILCAMLEDGISASVGAIFRDSSWQELDLSV